MRSVVVLSIILLSAAPLAGAEGPGPCVEQGASRACLAQELRGGNVWYVNAADAHVRQDVAGDEVGVDVVAAFYRQHWDIGWMWSNYSFVLAGGGAYYDDPDGGRRAAAGAALLQVGASGGLFDESGTTNFTYVNGGAVYSDREGGGRTLGALASYQESESTWEGQKRACDEDLTVTAWFQRIVRRESVEGDCSHDAPKPTDVVILLP